MNPLFFDIETHSTGERPKYDDKIIAIAYKTPDTPVTVLKEWETNEKQILKIFLQELRTRQSLVLAGHNILRFDIPVIIRRAHRHRLASLEDLMWLTFNAYPIDTL